MNNNIAKTNERNERYNAATEASTDIKKIAETIKKSENMKSGLPGKIESDLANGCLDDARETLKAVGKQHPLSKEAEELRNSARRGIESLMKNGGSMHSVITAAVDNDVPLDSLLPAAKEMFKKSASEENFDMAGAIAVTFRFQKAEVPALLKEALSETKAGSADSAAQKQATLEKFGPRR